MFLTLTDQNKDPMLVTMDKVIRIEPAEVGGVEKSASYVYFGENEDSYLWVAESTSCIALCLDMNGDMIKKIKNK